MQITGVRRSDGGIRAAAYKSCFDENETGCDNYRPLFWYTDLDKKDYENGYGIIHSKCYTEYGLKRTGCACCPYGKGFEEELRKFILENHYHHTTEYLLYEYGLDAFKHMEEEDGRKRLETQCD